MGGPAGGAVTPKFTPEQFNDLYLPIQWSDKNGNGEIDKGEIWVHPELNTINFYLWTRGETPIDPSAFIDPAKKYLTTPESKRIGNPVLTKELHSVQRIRSPFDLGIVPEGVIRNTVNDLISFAGLAQLYFNLQKDPNYIEQLRAVLATGDILRIRLFFQDEGAMCINNKCRIVPKGVPVDSNGIAWPDSWTKRDVDYLKTRYKWPEDERLKRRVFSPRSMIVECEKDEPDAFKYRGKYYRPVPLNKDERIRQVASLMANTLLMASDNIKAVDPDYARMLEQKAEFLLDQPLDGEDPVDFEQRWPEGRLFGAADLHRQWVETDNRYITFAGDSVETYPELGSPLGFKSMMEGVVAFRDDKLQKFADATNKTLAKSDEKLWALWEEAGESFPIRRAYSNPPVINIADNIIAAGALSYAAYPAGGFSQPNWDDLETDPRQEEKINKTVIFANVTGARIANQGLAVAKEAFTEDLVTGLEAIAEDIPAIITDVQSHEQAHTQITDIGNDIELCSMGDDYLDIKGDDFCDKTTLTTVYGEDLANAYSEMMRDAYGLLNQQLWEEEGIIDLEGRRGAQLVHFGNLFRNLYLGASNTHSSGSIVHFYYYVKHGVIKFDRSLNKYVLDQELLDRKIGVILKEIVDDFLSMDKERLTAVVDRAETLFKKGVLIKDGNDKGEKIGIPIKKFVDRVKVPRDNLPYYMPYYARQ